MLFVTYTATAFVAMSLAPAGEHDKKGEQKTRELYHNFDQAYWRSRILGSYQPYYDPPGTSPFESCPTEKSIPLLRSLLKDTDFDVRRYAAISARFLGSHAKLIVPELTKLLSDPEVTVRVCAIASLGKLGPTAKEAAPSLIKLLVDRDIEVRLSAAESLIQIDKVKFGDRVLSVLTSSARCNDADPRFQFEAINLLNEYSFAVPEVADTLIGILRDTSDESGVISGKAAEVIGRAKSNIPQAAAALESALADKRVEVRNRAACSLWQLTRRKAKCLPVLLEYCNEHGHHASERVLFEHELIDSLLSIGRTEPSALNALVVLCDKDRFYARERLELIAVIDSNAEKSIRAKLELAPK